MSVTSASFSSSESKTKYSLSSIPSQWELQCKEWINEEGVLYERYGVSTPPRRDFFYLVVTPIQVSMTVWEIKRSMTAISKKGADTWNCNYSSFKTDHQMRDVILKHCGEELKFLDRLVDGTINFFDRLPEACHSRIIRYLDVKSVVALACTSKYYQKLCYHDDVWKRLYRESNLKSSINPSLLNYSNGWRVCYVLATKISQHSESLSGRSSKASSKSITHI